MVINRHRPFFHAGYDISHVLGGRWGSCSVVWSKHLYIFYWSVNYGWFTKTNSWIYVLGNYTCKQSLFFVLSGTNQTQRKISLVHLQSKMNHRWSEQMPRGDLHWSTVEVGGSVTKLPQLEEGGTLHLPQGANLELSNTTQSGQHCLIGSYPKALINWLL